MISVSTVNSGYPSSGFQLLDTLQVAFDEDMYGLDALSLAITLNVWSHCLYAGNYRLEKFFAGSFYCVLDFDENVTKREALEKLAGYALILGPTKSDGVAKSGKPACDRFRVVLPWEAPIDRLDVYKFNARLINQRFGGDEQTFDGGRIWQPCKNIETKILSGKPMEVIWDIPKSETQAHKNKALSNAQGFLKESKTLSKSTMDFLSGRSVSGTLNKSLFTTVCELGSFGMDLEDIRILLGKVGDVSKWDKFESTLRSAAKRVGIL